MTTEAKHADELWRVSETYPTTVVAGVSGSIDYVVVAPGTESGEIIANARRMAATWNACDGIPTEALVPGGVRALVEALQGVMYVVRTYASSVEDCDEMQDARAALAPFTRTEKPKP